MIRQLFSIFLLLVLVATAAAGNKPEDWMEVRSPHFLVVTNAKEKEAVKVTDQFERMRAVFQKALPKLRTESGAPITVIAVKNEKDFRALEPEVYLAKGRLKLAGLFLQGAEKSFVLLRLDAGGEHPYATIYHEYTHYLTRDAQEWLPLWLNEGFAEFYENTDIRNKNVLLGQPSEQNIYLLREKKLLPLETLLTVDSSSPYYHEEDKGSIFYAESWVLTHYLMVKDFQEKTTRLGNYMKLVSQNVNPVEAANKAFGDLTELQKNLERYVRQYSFSQFNMPGAVTVDESAFQVQPISVTQANAIRAEFLARNQRNADARDLAQQVLREDPNNVSAHETMGYLAFRQGKLDEAKKWYEQAVKLDSHSYLSHYYFAAIAMSAGPGDSADEAQIENSLKTAIQLNPSFAPAYDRLAVFYGMHHRSLQEAHMAALSAIQLDPSNIVYRLNCANVLLSNQRAKDAIAVLQNALKLAKSPEDISRVQSSLQMAERFQAAQAEYEQRQRAISESNITETHIPAGTFKEREASLPTLRHRSEFHPGQRRTATGIIRNVQCSEPADMDLKLEAAKESIALHSDNFYKLRFSAVGFAPSGELHPCTQLEGMHAKVDFIESADKGVPGRITSVELYK